MAVSKVVYGNQTLIDLTGDTVTADTLLAGTTAHNKAGLQLTGTAVIPTKTSDLTNDSGFITASDNVASATKLQTARAIDGLEFNGTTDVTRYVLCETAAATSPKVVTVPNFKLVTGAEVTIRFAATNSKTSPTLNVSGTGEKQIRYRNAALSTSTTRAYLAANRIYKFVYDGEYWQIVGDIDTNTNNVTAQNISTANDTYPMLLGNTANATANIGNKATLFGAGIKANPSTSEITATGFIGDLTGTASNATADASGNVITTTYATKAEIPTVPTDVSAFTNDVGYITGITSSDVTSALGFTPANSTALSGYVPTSRTVNGKALSSNISLTASDVGALPDSTSIPTKTSDLTNDSGFIQSNSDIDLGDHGILGSTDGTGRTYISAGRNVFDGATLQLFGRDHATYAGRFYLRASTKSSSASSGDEVVLVGHSDGILEWNSIRASQFSAPDTSTYTALTLPASGSSVSAPNDGFVSLLINSTASNQYIRLDNGNVRQTCTSSGSGQTLSVYVPVSKGDSVAVRYTAALSSSSTIWFRFVKSQAAV